MHFNLDVRFNIHLCFICYIKKFTLIIVDVSKIILRSIFPHSSNWDLLIANFFQCSGIFIPHETLMNLPELLYTPIAVMDNLFTQNSSDELSDIPQTENSVWILGRKYNSKKGKSSYST